MADDRVPAGLLQVLRLRAAPFTFKVFRAAFRRLWMACLRWRFAEHGRNFWFDLVGCYTFEHIHVGEDVTLGYCPVLLATESHIYIGSKVMFGPQVSILGGDHNTRVLGQFMYDVRTKTPGDDVDVTIEDDVWVGNRAIILKGTRIGRGSIVAAGAIVRGRVPPYSVVAGVPARVVKHRWNREEALEHERMLYPPERRLEENELKHLPEAP